MVMQEPMLFNDTIRNNILYGNPKATDKQVYDAAMMANCLGFIEQEDESRDSTIKLKIEKEFKQRLEDIRKDFPSFLRIYDEFQGQRLTH
mmetsp:Transcript_38622/g.28492  ORF Transcript_38622/g.28492 Transcript_38622/m.28492 type:complete len:90 (+) Transcript_38622:849-1118(+)|eukprot:CAMPEP_0202968390 /NCGR_PEP_ID=MMETSP1396-20130829/13652_1 /ASSEMBLY_ACC=CAM_ASM_000872 /TAXON_ID= /ORGANISM="Pseudokeronopsis sp., Strain Brazil" /LENGTH=89 /DNA_ID=CAMNT_0049694635 /DNA_START=967 /DNA_END=1236 /DNA_ORIENTATION=+